MELSFSLFPGIFSLKSDYQFQFNKLKRLNEKVGCTYRFQYNNEIK